jgi:hypothetical protein
MATLVLNQILHSVNVIECIHILLLLLWQRGKTIYLLLKSKLHFSFVSYI